MEESSRVFKAALEKYIEEKNGIRFYADGVSAAMSKISEDGSIKLIHGRTRAIVASYEIESLGLSPSEINEDLATTCPDGSRISSGPTESIELGSINMSDKRKVLGIASSTLAFLGTFCPVATIPIAGSISYVANGRGDGVIVLIISLISLGFVLSDNYRLLRLSGCAALTIMFMTLFRFNFAISRASSLMEGLESNPFRGLAETAIGSIGLGWGWLPLLSGAAGLLVTSFVDVKEGKLSLRYDYLIPAKGINPRENISVLAGCSAVVGFVLAAISQNS